MVSSLESFDVDGLFPLSMVQDSPLRQAAARAKLTEQFSTQIQINPVSAVSLGESDEVQQADEAQEET